ncbi:hypothetical protein POM88_005125 [Heracleum sosnowskyi]|uniref:Uncharacterized protein n=1 Tax=Heracleum sosnowskyi TaxID=360622 RepID=A0AAD8JPE3_9APIA|nr:hypothetical protein POM88_005125 [Heracleum sosnowskyi]
MKPESSMSCSTRKRKNQSKDDNGGHVKKRKQQHTTLKNKNKNKGDMVKVQAEHLEELLASHERNHLINNKNQVVPLHSLEVKVVGLFFYEDGSMVEFSQLVGKKIILLVENDRGLCSQLQAYQKLDSRDVPR